MAAEVQYGSLPRERHIRRRPCAPGGARGCSRAWSMVHPRAFPFAPTLRAPHVFQRGAIAGVHTLADDVSARDDQAARDGGGPVPVASWRPVSYLRLRDRKGAFIARPVSQERPSSSSTSSAASSSAACSVYSGGGRVRY